MATGGVGMQVCPLCNAPVEGGDQLQLHYLTSCSGYDHGGSATGGIEVGVASNSRPHPSSSPQPPSSATSLIPASSSTKTTSSGGKVAASNHHTIQFMWQPLTQMSYPKVTLLTSLESGSIDLKLDRDAADGGFYSSDLISVPTGTYEGQLVVGDSFINPVKTFTVDSTSHGVVILEFEITGRNDSFGLGGPDGGMQMQANPSFNQRYGYNGGGGGDSTYQYTRRKTDVSTAHSVALAAANNTDINLPLSPHTSPTTQHTLTASQGTTDSYSHQLSEEGFDPATVKYKPGRLSQTTPPQPVVSHNSAYVTGTTVTTTPVLLTAGTHPGGGTQGSDVGSMGGSDWKKGISQNQSPGEHGETEVPSTSSSIHKMPGNDHDRQRDDGFSVNSIQNHHRHGDDGAVWDYEHQLAQLQERLAKMTEEKVVMLQDRERVSAQWEGKVRRLKLKLKEKKEEQGMEHDDKLEDEVEETRSQLDTMTAQVATLLDKLREKEGEMEVKEAQLKEMKNMNAALENQLTEYMDALEHQNKSVQRTVTNSAELAKVEQESAQMAMYMRKQQLEYEEALQSLQRKVGRADEVEKENLKIHQLNLNLTGELEDYRHQTKTLLADLRRKEEEIATLQQQRNKLGSSDRSQLEVESMQQKCDAWKDEVEKLSPLRDQVAHLQQDIIRLQQEVGRLSDHNAGLTAQLQEAAASSSGREMNEWKRKAADYDQLMERVTELQQVRVQLENELSPLRAERANILSENATLREGSQPDKYLRLKNDYTKLSDHCIQLQRSLANESNECELLQKRLAEEAAVNRKMEEANSQLQQQLQETTDEKSLQAIRDRMDRYKSERDQLRMKVSKMETELQTYCAQQAENSQTIENLTLALEGSAQHTHRDEQWQKQLDSLAAKLEESNKRMHRYREERNKAHIVLGSCQDQVTTLQNTVEQLKNSSRSYTSGQLETTMFTQLQDDVQSLRQHEIPSPHEEEAYSPDLYSEQLRSSQPAMQSRPSSGPNKSFHKQSVTSSSSSVIHKHCSPSSSTSGNNAAAMYTEVTGKDGVTQHLLIEKPRYKLDPKSKPKVIVRRKGGNFESGVLAFLGVLDGKEMAGIILDFPGGNNDGQYRDGKHYFRCTPSHGLYCPLANVYIESV